MKLFFWIGVGVLIFAFINEKMLSLVIGLYFLYSLVLLSTSKHRIKFSVILSFCILLFITLLFLIDYIRPFFLYITKIEGGVGYAQYFGYPLHFDDFYFFILLAIFLLGTLIFSKFIKK